MPKSNLRKGAKIDYKKMNEGGAEYDIEPSHSSGISPPKLETVKSTEARLSSSSSLIEEIPSDDDEELQKLNAEYEQLSQEQAKLLKLREKEEMRQKLQKKREEVAALKQEFRRVIIVGDSIVKNLPPIEGVKVQAFPGATIGKLSFLVSKKQVSLYDSNFIILHIGTNNIANQNALNSLASDFTNLIAAIRKENASIRIIVSSILPRPVDHSCSDKKIREFNHFLEDRVTHLADANLP
ncbi:uncharacterized protein LOC123541508 [Mercenaria mercenaria]|uniref:uncharacterized protein LOC123541508 n=1 Tax=Mercenaria mercenaria TaxID=6596 RepID=UPI00234E400A|nr:uncharacterized protein LOC123541508 [Mercenaria mercenaria]